MTNKDLELQLQNFAEDNLVRTSYGVECDGYQENQLRLVIAKINDALNIFPNIAHELDKITLVPPIDRIGNTKMANIGTSATKCLQVLQSGEYDKTLGDKASIIVAYLKQVAAQAQEICKKEAEEKHQQETIEKTVVRLLAEHIKDLETTQKRLNENLAATIEMVQQATQSASDVQKLSEDAKSAAADAKQSAEAAEDTANNAKTEANAAQVAAEAANDTISKANQAVETATKGLEKAEKTAESIIPTMLTVLGIFVAIIVAVVACYLSILLINQGSATGNHTLPIEITRYLIMGHIMLMVIFILLYLVSKLTSRSITSHCNKFEEKQNAPDDALKECERCKHKCPALVRFRLQYTYIFTINVIFFVGYILLGIWQVINVYYRTGFDRWIQSHPFWVSVIIMGFTASFMFVLWLIFRKKKTK